MYLQEIIPSCFILFRARQTDELLEELEREQYVFVIEKGYIIYVWMNEFLDDNKQILEPKVFNIFC